MILLVEALCEKLTLVTGIDGILSFVTGKGLVTDQER
jgi:hypothetical protein